MTETAAPERTIQQRLVEIQKNYEASKGISYEDLRWLLFKMDQAGELAEAGQRLAEAAKNIVHLQKIRISELEAELATHDN